MGATRYTPELAVGLRVPSDAHVSPDGGRVAFVVAPVGHEETKPTSAIWMVEVSGDAPARAFTGGRAEDKMPRWSPDGERLAFLASLGEWSYFGEGWANRIAGNLTKAAEDKP